jgi:hypothetical protein
MTYNIFKIRFKIALVFLFVVTYSHGQLPQIPSACVLTAVGNSYKAGRILLKPRSFILREDSIIVTKGAVLSILGDDNTYIVINQIGKYKYSELKKHFDMKPTGISERFFKLIWNGLFKSASEQRISKGEVIGNAFGATIKGSCDDLIEPVNNFMLSRDTILFRWKSTEDAETYKFTLKNEKQDELINLITHDTVLTLLKRGLLINSSTTYYWNLTPVGSKTVDCSDSPHFFVVMSKSECQKRVKNLVQQVPINADEALYLLKLSEHLALNGFYDESQKHYLKAIGGGEN